MIDSHCHLDLPAFEQDWQSVISRAKIAGVTRILIPGTQVSRWPIQQSIQCDAKHAEVPFPIDIAFGLHPYFLSDNHDENLRSVTALEHVLSVERIKLVALGEIGLDGHIDTPLQSQRYVFEAQLALAMDHKLPVILHHRKSHHLIFESIKTTGFTGGGVIHAFSGSLDVAKAYIEKGFYIGVGGTITYERAKKTRDTIAYLLDNYPDRLLLETDSPDMPIQGRQGSRNSPEYLCEILTVLSELVGVNIQTIETLTTQNYNSLFLNKPQK